MQVTTTALTTAQQHLLSPSPGIKGGTNVVGNNGGVNTTDQTSEQLTNPSPSVAGSSYNVTRVKYQVKQHAAHVEEEKSQLPSNQIAQSSSQQAEVPVP